MSCCEIKESSKVWNNTNRAKIFIVSLTIKSTIISLDWIQVKKIKFIVFYSIVTSTKRRTTREMDPLKINLYAKIQVQIIFKFKLKLGQSSGQCYGQVHIHFWNFCSTCILWVIKVDVNLPDSTMHQKLFFLIFPHIWSILNTRVISIIIYNQSWAGIEYSMERLK